MCFQCGSKIMKGCRLFTKCGDKRPTCKLTRKDWKTATVNRVKIL